MIKLKGENIIIGRYKSIIASIFLLVFGLYFANISLFYHQHIIGGKVISHSHFHNSNHTQDPCDPLAHTTDEIILIQLNSNFTTESPSDTFILDAEYLEIHPIYAVYEATNPEVGYIYSKPHRGPPSETIIG